MQSFLYLLLTLAILVFVHEYGHFWVARRCGVKVLKFSIGFGKPLWRRLGKDGTEYVVAWIPLGGFVKMLDEREGEVAEEELDQAFNRKSLAARSAIVAAGPAANLLFAIATYWLMFTVGVPGLAPIIGDVAPNSAAAEAQLVQGDEIKAVNGYDTPTWNSVNQRLATMALDGGDAVVTIAVDGDSSQLVNRTIILDKHDFSQNTQTSLLSTLGLTPVRTDLIPVIGKVIKGGAAEAGGLQTNDLIVAIDSTSVMTWREVVAIVKANPDTELNVLVERQGEKHELTITPTKTADNTGRIGVLPDSSKTPIDSSLMSVERYGIVDGFIRAVYKTWSFSVATLKSLGGMITGNVSSKNIGGPITIAQYASDSANSGFIAFCSFLAMISISLGLLNLLPIPVLDGGHLFMYLIEWIKGEELSQSLQIFAQKIGIILLMMLMFLAFFNDLSRLFG